jgi:hypothetical protein
MGYQVQRSLYDFAAGIFCPPGFINKEVKLRINLRWGEGKGKGALISEVLAYG